MLKDYNKLWVFGDSYTTPEVCVKPQDSFWGLTAQHLKIGSIENCSKPVNSFDSVCHLLISMQDQYNWDHDLFLIGIATYFTLRDQTVGNHLPTSESHQ